MSRHGALADAVPDRYRTLVILAAGSGMRQGECFGLTVDRIDFLRRIVRVDRQLVTVSGQPSDLGPPRTSASVRTIPVPQLVIDALAAHLSSYPPREGLVFLTDAGNPGASYRVRRRLAGGRQRGKCAQRDRLSRAQTLLRQLADQAW